MCVLNGFVIWVLSNWLFSRWRDGCCPVFLTVEPMRSWPSNVKPIEYSKTQSKDPVDRLLGKIEAGAVSLKKRDGHGYLVSLLEELEIPTSSQTLVFSKSSLQRHLISPSSPRAIYFNDEVYLGLDTRG